MVADLGSW